MKKNEMKITMTTLFSWFITRPRALRRFLGRNHESFQELFKALSAIGGVLFWPGVFLYVFGIPLGLTLLWAFLLLIVGSLASLMIIGACAMAPDRHNTDHKWSRIKARASNGIKTRPRRERKPKTQRGDIIITSVVPA